MKVFTNYKDIRLIAQILVYQGTHKQQLLEFVEAKQKQGILSPEKLSAQFWGIAEDLKYKTLGYKQTRKSRRIFEAYLKHKGHQAQVYKFTTQLFKQPSYKIGGFNIAVESGTYLNKSCVYYSIIC